MLTLTLKRTTRDGKAVRGNIVLPFTQRPIYAERPEQDLIIPTLENADFLIPAGTYPLKITYSPKFKKDLPLIDEVPDRTGIRIHMGTLPEHSTGCILTNFAGMAYIKTLFNRLDKYYDEEQISLCIMDAC